MLTSVNEVISELAAYCHLSYAESTSLRFGSFTVLSQEGAQQGDPLGPLFFCLPLQSILTHLESQIDLRIFGRSHSGQTPRYNNNNNFRVSNIRVSKRTLIYNEAALT